MGNKITTLAALLDPVTPETFFAEYYGKRPLHVPGAAEKFNAILSWDRFVDLLNMTGIWTSASLKMKLDRRDVPPQMYCSRIVDRNQQNAWQPNPQKVMEFARRGASLVCNEIESLTPGLRDALAILEQTFNGRANCNLYCSWQDRQAFNSHYDKHEVFALHLEGEKHWRIYEGRIDNPIHHALFANQTQEYLDSQKGPVMQELTTRPGDLLYIPRGQFHDALATGHSSLHVTYALAVANGLMLLTDAWERAAANPLFRADLPSPAEGDYEERLADHLRALENAFSGLISGPAFVERAKQLHRAYRVNRHTYDLSPDASSTRHLGPGSKDCGSAMMARMPCAKREAALETGGGIEGAAELRFCPTHIYQGAQTHGFENTQYIMSQALKRINVSYSPVEDRLILSIETAGDTDVKIWLTRRFTSHLWLGLLTVLKNFPDPSGRRQRRSPRRASWHAPRRGGPGCPRIEEPRASPPTVSKTAQDDLAVGVEIGTVENGVVPLMLKTPKQNMSINLDENRCTPFATC